MIDFTLPDGWTPGQPGVALCAGRRTAGFTPTITVDVEERLDHATLADLADESVARLSAVGPASLAERTSHENGLTQVVRVADLTQCQVYLALHDVADDRRRVVVQLALTAPADALDGVLPDFRQVVSSVRLGD